MTWSQVRAFVHGSLIVLVDAVVGPAYRWAHKRSRR